MKFGKDTHIFLKCFNQISKMPSGGVYCVSEDVDMILKQNNANSSRKLLLSYRGGE